MKNLTKYGRCLFVALLVLAGAGRAAAQGTAFMYQGNLDANSTPANGFFDFEFSLYPNAEGSGAKVGSTITQTNIGVTNGLFTIALDFGAVLTGNDTWLAMSVRSNGVGSYTALTPLQELTPTPYAIFANTASNLSGKLQAAQLSGTYSGAVTLDNAGNSFTGNGSGLTGLNASQLTQGTVADALLSANVALLDANQTFTGVNTFGGANQGLIVNGGPVGTNLFTGLGLQYNAASGEAAIISSLDDNRSFLTFYTKEGAGVPSVQQMKIDRNGVVMIDDQANNYGALNDNTTNGAGLVFGGNSGEGIASQRTAGVNKDGLDFYTSYNHRMSILHNGNVGIGTTNPATTLQVNGTVTATAFIGDGSGLTNVPGASLLNNNSGTLNFFAGQSAGNQTMTGTHNTGVGDGALSVNSGGDYNTAEGNSALTANTTGGNNTALGVYALWQNTNGNGNTALGADALAYNVSGSDNTATGLGALENNTSSDNTADGVDALNNNEGGFQNTGIGYGALSANTSGNYNTATGAGALGNNNGSDNAAFGAGALGLNSSGTNNVAVGESALAFNQTGYNNTATGYAALAFNTSGNNNTADGYYSMGGTVSSSGGNTAIGGYTLYDITDGYNNTAAGYEALYADSTGVDNVGIGVATFQASSTGSANTGIGTYAFQLMTAGTGNVGIGYYAGHYLIAGTNNIYIGNSGFSSDNEVIRIGDTQTQTYIAGTVNCDAITTGPHTCCSITITGGCDLAEPFPISTAEQQVKEGAVVVIDEKNPGHVKLADRPYDTRVAGVVSGANGVNPGIQMQQQGLLEGGKNVALTGRVYVQADASNGAIEPGDLLTTSGSPGRAMKVTDHIRGQGAILGKAMTELSEGNGMVLVLVTLQ